MGLISNTTFFFGNVWDYAKELDEDLPRLM